MYSRGKMVWIFLALIPCLWMACTKPVNAPGGSSGTNLNSVESEVVGTWRLVSKIDSSIQAGNILSTTTYSNFTYSPIVVFGALVDNVNLNPVAKTYSFKDLNLGPAFEGPPDSTLSGKGTWYYDLGNKSMYLNFGRYGFSMTNSTLTISVSGDGSPPLTNSWTFTKQ